MYGLDRVTALIEAKKAALVIIAHDVDPIGLVICFLLFVERWAYRDVIVKGKARLGTVVHKKTAAIVAIQEVRSEDDRELATLISVAKTNLYCDGHLIRSGYLSRTPQISHSPLAQSPPN